MDDSESKPAWKHWASKLLLSKAFIIAVAVVIVYTLIGFFHVEVKPDGRLNLIDLVDRIPKEEAAESKPGEEKDEEKEAPPRVILDRIALNQGRVVFTDRSDPTHASVTVEPLGIELSNFTTLPEKKGMHRIEASFPLGGKLNWTGEVSVHPLWSEGSLSIKDFRLATAWEFLQDELLLDKPAGSVDLAARYRFSYNGEAPALVIDGLKVLVSDMALRARGNEAALFSMDTIRLDEGRFTPAEKSADATIEVSDLALTPLQPYVAQVAFLSLDSGAFSLAGELHHKESQKSPATTHGCAHDFSQRGNDQPYALLGQIRRLPDRLRQTLA